MKRNRFLTGHLSLSLNAHPRKKLRLSRRVEATIGAFAFHPGFV